MGAKAPKAVTPRAPSDLAGVAVHWFGDPSSAASHDGCMKLLQGVQRTHMAPGGLGAKRGGSDIAHNDAVCPHGFAFTLRGFGVQTGANGDAKSNREYAAVVYMAGAVRKTSNGRRRRPCRSSPRSSACGRARCGAAEAPPFLHRIGLPGAPTKWVGTVRTPGGRCRSRPGPAGGGRDAAVAARLRLLAARRGRRSEEAAEKAPKPIPESAWKAAARMDRMATLMSLPRRSSTGPNGAGRARRRRSARAVSRRRSRVLVQLKRLERSSGGRRGRRAQRLRQ